MEYLIVDVDSRIIKIPETITHLGVKDDNETRTLKFQMPKVYKGLDLSDYNLEINFINANNKSDSALTENKQIDGDNITFEWCVGKSAYAKNGKVNFLVYAYLENEYGIKTNEWHTTWAKLDVLDGGNVNGAIAEENPRIIEEMLRRIKELENAEKDAVLYTAQTLTEEQQTQARANIGAASSVEVSELSEEIDKLGGGAGTVISSVEPADDDIPKVFIDGEIPTSKTELLATMKYVSKTDEFFAYIKIKCQGTSSMSYPKKNFTVKLYSDEERETNFKKLFKDWKNEESKYVLKANYVDHSHARNIVCARLWNEVVSNRSDYEMLQEELKTSPKHGAVDGFPIKVYTNGTYQGVYTWNIGKDAWMWNMDEENPNHVLLCAEKNTDGTYAENACNFRALWNGVDGNDWSVEVGTNSTSVKNSLNALITCVKDTDDETFKSTIENYLDIQSAIDYYIHQYIICGLDGLAKNMLLGTYDLVKWHCGAYDMDSTFGLWWNGTMYVATDYACPEDYQEQFSLLWERIEKVFVNELKERYSELRQTVYSISNMFTHFERFMDVIGSDLYTEDLKIYTGIPSGSTNNITQIRNYIRDRLAYCDTEFEKMTEPVPATRIILDQTSLTFVDTTPITLVAAVEPSNTTDEVIWDSSDTSVATVNDGVVTPVGNGDCTITATAGSVSASCVISVNDIVPVVKLWSDTATNKIDDKNGAVLTTGGDAYLCEYLEIPDGATTVTLKNINAASYTWKKIYLYKEDDSLMHVFPFSTSDGNTILETVIDLKSFPEAKYLRATAYPNKVTTNNDPNNQLEFVFG